MAYLLVQPWADGRDRYQRATIVGEYTTADEAFAALEAYARRLQHFRIRPDALELFVVDEQRRPMLRGH